MRKLKLINFLKIELQLVYCFLVITKVNLINLILKILREGWESESYPTRPLAEDGSESQNVRWLASG